MTDYGAIYNGIKPCVFRVCPKRESVKHQKKGECASNSEKKVRARKRVFFFPFVIILLWAKCELGVIETLGLNGFLALLLSCTHLLIVNFVRVISASGCRLVKPNHLNLCIMCDCLIFVIPHSSYFISHGSWEIGLIS